jgi:hypothetical protein
MPDAVAPQHCAPFATPTCERSKRSARAWLQHLLERFYSVAPDLKAPCHCGGLSSFPEDTRACFNPDFRLQRRGVEWAGAAIDSLGQTWRQKRSLSSMRALLAGLCQARGDLSRMKFGWRRSRIKAGRPLLFHQLATRESGRIER